VTREGGKIVPLRSGGRVRYTPQLADQIVGLAQAGKSMRQIAAELGIAYRTLYLWQTEVPAFAERMRLARKQAAGSGLRPGFGPGVSSRSDEREAIILEALEGGAGRAHAAAAAGVHPGTLEGWIEQDQELELRVVAAESRCQQTHLAIVRAAGAKTWQAAAWMLERRFPELYARRFELPYQERMKIAKKMGGDLADLLVKGLAEADLPQEQQELVRAKMVEALERAAQGA